MRTRLCHAALILAGGAAVPAWADGGLTIDAEQVPWPRLQTRVGLATTLPLGTELVAPGGPGLQGARVLGDYYFTGGRLFGSSQLSGGFRATSGLLLGSQGSSFSMPTVPRAGFGLSVSQQSVPAGALADGGAEAGHAVPYVGLGYTGLSVKGGWGFTADLGVMGLGPGSGLRPGKPGSGGQSLDELLRDLRLTPVLQVGVSYSF